MVKQNARTALRLPYQLMKVIKADAKNRKLSFSELVRQILEQHYEDQDEASGQN